jgi:hypothetical protein
VENPDLKKYNGKTVAEMAKAENKEEPDALFDFILKDNAQNALFHGCEQDLITGLVTWTSIGLDASESPSMARFSSRKSPSGIWFHASLSRRYVRDRSSCPSTGDPQNPQYQRHSGRLRALQIGYLQTSPSSIRRNHRSSYLH